MNLLYLVEEENKKKERKVLLKSYETDTGFNAICCSCNEYKSKESCSKVFKRNSNESKFTDEQIVEYLNIDENYNMSIDWNFYVCHSCSRQINTKKKPKRNDRDFLQYYDFPKELFKEVKEKCSPAEKLQNQSILPEE